MLDIQINQEQLQEILAKVEPEAIKQPLEDLLRSAASKGYGIAKQRISGGTEQAAFSMRYDVEPLTAKVHSVMPQARAMSIEEGRPPGQPPALVAVHRWLTGDRYFMGRRLNELSKEARARALAAQEAIRQHGAKGKKFIAGAWDLVQKGLPEMLDAMAKKIESRFGK